MLEEVIERGARSGVFAVPPESQKDQILAAHVFWSAVHGLTTLAIDHLMGPGVTVDDMIEQLLRIQIRGLRTA